MLTLLFITLFAYVSAQSIPLSHVAVMPHSQFPQLSRRWTLHPTQNTTEIVYPLHSLQQHFNLSSPKDFFHPVFGEVQADTTTWTHRNFPSGKYYDSPSTYAQDCTCTRVEQQVTLRVGVNDIRVTSLRDTWLKFNYSFPPRKEPSYLTNSFTLLSLFLTTLLEKFVRVQANVTIGSAVYRKVDTRFDDLVYSEIPNICDTHRETRLHVLNDIQPCSTEGCVGALRLSIPVGAPFREGVNVDVHDDDNFLPACSDPHYSFWGTITCNLMLFRPFIAPRMFVNISLFEPRFSHFSSNELIATIPHSDLGSRLLDLFLLAFPQKWFPNNTVITDINAPKKVRFWQYSTQSWCSTDPFAYSNKRPTNLLNFYKSYPVNLRSDKSCFIKRNSSSCRFATGSPNVAIAHGITLDPFGNVSNIPEAPVRFKPTRFRTKRFIFVSLIACLFSEATIHHEMQKFETELTTRLNALQTQIDQKFNETEIQIRNIASSLQQTNFVVEDLRDSTAALARDLQHFEQMQLSEDQHLLRLIQRNRLLGLQNQRERLELNRASLANTKAERDLLQACLLSLRTLGNITRDNTSIYSLTLSKGILRLSRLMHIQTMEEALNSSNTNFTAIKKTLREQDFNISTQLDDDISKLDNTSKTLDFTFRPLVFTEDSRLFNFSHNDFFSGAGAGVNSLAGVLETGLNDVRDVVDNTVDDATGILGQPLLMIAIIGSSALGAFLLLVGGCYIYSHLRRRQDNGMYRKGFASSTLYKRGM